MSIFEEHIFLFPEMNSLKIIITLVLLLINSLSLSAQTNSLKGTVTDYNTGKPVQGVLVFISYNYMTYTDNEGFYILDNIRKGIYPVKISRLGYKVISDTVAVVESGIIQRDYKIELTPIELDEIIVSTNRTENYLRNSAYSEILMGSEEIEVRPYQSLPEALKYQPGISLLRDGIWGAEVNIRGLSRENVVTLIDGSRISTSTDIAARLSLIDMNDIERIEVIKGASSSMYGSGATGGIVNIISKSPGFSSSHYLDGNLSSGYSSVNNLNVNSISLQSGYSNWAAKVSASYRNAGNTQTPAGELKNSQFEDYSLSAGLHFKPFENQILKLNYQLFKAEDVGIPGASIFPGNAVVRYPDEKRELISAGYEIFNLSDLLYKLSFKYSYQYIDRNVENIPNTVQTTPTRRVSVLKITPGAEHRGNNIELTGNLLLSENNNLAAGIDYWDRSYKGHRERYQLIEILNQAGEVTSTINRVIGEMPLPDSRARNLGIFLQDEMLLNNRLSLSLGARADHIFISGEETYNPVYEIINGTRNNNLRDSVIWERTRTTTSSYSSNLGIRYSLTADLDLTLSLGLSFRSPSLEERFQFIDQGNFIRLGNPKLKPELGRAADLGLRLYRDDVKIISSIFFNYFTDLVVETPGTFDERPAFIKNNIGEARLYGFDLSAEYNFYKEFIFYSTVSYVKGDDITSSGPLPGIPPLNSSTGIKAKWFKILESDISADVFSEQNNHAAGELRTPGYAVFNFSLNTTPINFNLFNLQVYAGVENIFDKAYRNHLATTRGSIRLEPGRNIYLKLITRW